MFYKFCIVAAVLWVNLPTDEARSSLSLSTSTRIDELQFWEPDPKFDGRRSEKNKNNEQKTHRGKTIMRTKSGSKKTTVNPHFSAKLNTSQTKENTSEPKHFRAKKIGRQETEPDHKSTRIDTNKEKQKPTPSQNWWTSNKSKSDSFELSPYSIAQQLIAITSQMPEANVSVEILGQTAEYNDIVLLKITEKKSQIDKYFRADDKYIDELPQKKIIFIVHALSVMGVNHMEVFKHSHYYTKLFSFYFAHLDKYDIFLIPMANPDGYAYVMNNVKNAVWNKNRSPQNGCAGVALDRNFDVEWNTSKSINPCNQKFPGFTPFSEPETRAVRDVFHRYNQKIIAYMHLHSGVYNVFTFKGDAVLYPKGYSDAQSDDDKYIDLKSDIDESMKNGSFQYASVAVETLYNWYGKVQGSSVDYASTVYGIPYALELVMQIFDQPRTLKVKEGIEYFALEEIWGRVIDVIFESIWKNMHANDVQ